MPGLRVLRAIHATVVGLVVLGAAAVAEAQDYTVTSSTGKLETRPAGATQITSASTALSNSHEIIELPFEFRYFGRAWRQVHLDVNGFLLPGNRGAIVSANAPFGNHGWDLTSGAFPYTDQGQVNQGEPADADGIIAPLWTRYDCINSGGCTGGNGSIYTWTSGTAPNRHFVVSWERAVLGNTSTTGTATVQVHLYESGQIVFAYDPTGDYSKPSYVCGIDSYGDNRYVVPMANSRTITGKPTSDFVFTPRTVTVTGRLQYDRIVSDSTGIGNSVAEDQDVRGLDIELTRDGGILAATGRTSSDGSFSLPAVAPPTNSDGEVAVLARNEAVRVAISQGGSVTSWAAAGNIDLGADAALGTLSLDDANDSGASIRSAIHVAVQCGRAREWVASHTSTPVPRVEVALDDTVGRTTFFQPGSGGGASLLTIAGKLSTNPDAWDDAVFVHAWAREVLAALAAAPPGTPDHRFDAPTDAQNAFAEAFGYALWSAAWGTSTVIDGTSASSASVQDLENPTLSTRDGTVAGSVAAGLYDTIDGANETVDVVDGTGVESRFLSVVEAASVAPNVESFIQAWSDAGHDAVGLTRSFIGSGALPDDADEPNDRSDETTALGDLGVLRTGRQLQRFNEDWFTVTLPSGVPALRADVSWNRNLADVTIVLEVRSTAGTLLATGTPQGTTGPYRAVTGPIAAGTYRIAVRHATGPAISSYDVQAYQPLDLPSAPLRDWTVGVPYNQALGLAGGIPPFTFTTPSSALPPGLSVNTQQLTAAGSPTTAGTFSVTLEVKDSGKPQNVDTSTHAVTIAPPVDVAIPAYLGFPHGRSVVTTLPVTGGTAPVSFELSEGELPDGLALEPGTLRVTGTATTVGSTSVRFAARDVPGSSDSALTQAIVCPAGAPKGLVLDLAAGPAACGFYVDAVRGSTLGFSVKTARGFPKRDLAVTVLGPDRAVVVDGKIKLKPGKAAGSAIPCALSGRYYVVLSSVVGEAVQLVAGTTPSTPKSVKGLTGTLAPGTVQTLEFGALPGTKLALKASPPKQGNLIARCTGLVDPEGNFVDPAEVVEVVGRGFKINTVLALGGTWQVLLVGAPADASPASVKYSVVLKPPRGSVYVAE